MLAANAELDVGPRLTAPLDGHPDQFADALDIDRDEGVLLHDAAVAVVIEEGAGVVGWNSGGNRVVLKESTNGMVCYDRSDNPGTRPFAVQCTDQGNLDRVEQTLKAYADGGDRQSGQKLLDAMEENGTRIAPVFGSLWHTVNADDAASAGGPHITIAVPGATADSLGIPAGNSSTLMWIMDPGTTTAHLMLPGR